MLQTTTDTLLSSPWQFSLRGKFHRQRFKPPQTGSEVNVSPALPANPTAQFTSKQFDPLGDVR